MTVAYRVTASATHQDNHLEVEPILERSSPRASFCITDDDPYSAAPVVELDLEEIRELRDILGKVEKTLEPLWDNPED